MPQNNKFTTGYKTYDNTHARGSKSKWQKAFQQKVSLAIKEHNPHQEILSPLFTAASKTELTKAYRILLRKHHPDHSGDTEQNQEITRVIISTYMQLFPQLL